MLEQIIIGILTGVAINVVEANARYHGWLASSVKPGGVAYVPIRHAVGAKAFLNHLEARALAG